MKYENILLENATQQACIISESLQGHNGDEFHFLVRAAIKPSKGT